MVNSVDPDQLASEKPADQDLHCFQHRIYQCLACYRVKQIMAKVCCLLLLGNDPRSSMRGICISSFLIAYQKYLVWVHLNSLTEMLPMSTTANVFMQK